MVRRALLYIRRKKSRSIILLLLMIVLAISISIGLSVWSGLNHAIHEVQKTLGTSFIVKMPDNMTVGPFEMIELNDGTKEQTYVGPRVDQQLSDGEFHLCVRG